MASSNVIDPQRLYQPLISTADISANNQVIGFRNKIHNGAMTIDQRNVGASVSAAANALLLDRWRAYNVMTNIPTVTQFALTSSSTPPMIAAKPQFNYAMLWKNTATATTDSTLYNVTWQAIEGNNTNDLQWGTSAAKAVTISFWVYASIAGISTISLRNGAPNISFTAPYTITAANTWQFITIPILGPTTGAWNLDTNIGVQLLFGLQGTTTSTFVCPVASYNQWIPSSAYIIGANATNFGATANSIVAITGVQLEIGNLATAFEWRPYETEMRICQRYFEKSYDYSIVVGSTGSGNRNARFSTCFNTSGAMGFVYMVEKRGIPTVTYYAPGTGVSGSVNLIGGASYNASSGGDIGTKGVGTIGVSNATTGTIIYFHFTASAEF